MKENTCKSRIYNSKKNVSYGLIVTVLTTLVAFVNRTFFVKCLGAEYLGLDGLFSEVIAMLSLAELGVGMAINYSLYKPIHDKDYKQINQLMSLFKKTYNYIALVIFILGMAILPFVHYIVNGTDFELSFIRLVFFLFVLNTSTSYLFSYNISFITADQKQYVVTMISAIMKVAFAILTIAVLLLFHDFILFLLLSISQTLATNIYLSYYVRKKYPFITFKDNLPVNERRRIFGDIKNIFIKRVSGVITSSSTNVLISTLVSTIQVGFYSNYTIFFAVIRTLCKQFSNGIKASIGDLSVAESPEKCIQILRRLTFMFFAFSLIVCSGFAAMCSDFISLWLGPNFVMSDIIIFVAIYNLFIEISVEPLWQYLEVSGLFKQDRNIAILGSSINIIVAIIMGYIIGIVGIFLGTLSTQLIQIVLKSKLLFNTKWSTSSKGYLFFLIKMGISFLLVLILLYIYDQNVKTEAWLINFIVKGLFAVLLSAGLLLFLFRKSSEYEYCVLFIKEIINKSH